jgi:hypothetical protein
MRNITIGGKDYPFPKKINMAIMKEWETLHNLKYSDLDTNDLTHSTTLFYLCIVDEAEARGMELDLTQKQFDRMMDSQTMVEVAKNLSGSLVPNVESSIEQNEGEVGNLQVATEE